MRNTVLESCRHGSNLGGGVQLESLDIRRACETAMVRITTTMMPRIWHSESSDNTYTSTYDDTGNQDGSDHNKGNVILCAIALRWWLWRPWIQPPLSASWSYRWGCTAVCFLLFLVSSF